MLIIKNAEELATCRTRHGGPSAGGFFSDCGIIKKGALVAEGERIVAVGETGRILAQFQPKKKDLVIDASGKIVLPGFIDCHTHAVFAGSRAEEYELKLKGASYAMLQGRGGGIHSTVRATRRAGAGELFSRAKNILQDMLRHGTTTIEIKSGYGLTSEAETKILRVIERLRKTSPQDIIATFLGAHTVPLEYQNKRVQYVRVIIEQMLPRVKGEGLAEYCDVFCDPLGFSTEEARKIFSRARELGMRLRIHAEQTARIGGARLAADYKAVSADHCDFANVADVRRLKQSGTIAVLLPGVLFHLMEWEKISRLQRLVKNLREGGVPIALATDYNPGSSPVRSMKIIADLAIRFLKLDYAECLNAMTVNAAYALDRSDRLGSIERGKQADVLVIDSPSIKEYFHQVGDQSIDYVIKRGVVVRG